MSERRETYNMSLPYDYLSYCQEAVSRHNAEKGKPKQNTSVSLR